MSRHCRRPIAELHRYIELRQRNSWHSALSYRLSIALETSWRFLIHVYIGVSGRAVACPISMRLDARKLRSLSQYFTILPPRNYAFKHQRNARLSGRITRKNYVLTQTKDKTVALTECIAEIWLLRKSMHSIYRTNVTISFERNLFGSTRFMFQTRYDCASMLKKPFDVNDRLAGCHQRMSRKPRVAITRQRRRISKYPLIKFIFSPTWQFISRCFRVGNYRARYSPARERDCKSRRTLDS